VAQRKESRMPGDFTIFATAPFALWTVVRISATSSSRLREAVSPWLSFE
jgi:hypothetical protein